ncbi:MAG TPA: hypothetical protein PLI43_15750 [Albidovulum sp.]|uniref:hypothetical protein n=1 Tax=Albidovulum sp. TaxID=1872424 RepID=UPI002C85CF69|nr:hypothetical protein [Albidovulum sp.]
MKNTPKTFAVLVALASLPLAAMAQTTSTDKPAAPTMGSGDMMGMMGSGTMDMDGRQMDAMMGQMMQMMMMMEMMQMTKMMAGCEKMMAAMPMTGTGADPMMTAPAPKG